MLDCRQYDAPFCSLVLVPWKDASKLQVRYTVQTVAQGNPCSMNAVSSISMNLWSEAMAQ